MRIEFSNFSALEIFGVLVCGNWVSGATSWIIIKDDTIHQQTEFRGLFPRFYSMFGRITATLTSKSSPQRIVNKLASFSKYEILEIRDTQNDRTRKVIEDTL